MKNLAAGPYTLVIFPYSSVRNAFDYGAAVALPITVAGSAAAPPAPAPLRPLPRHRSSGSELRVLQWNIHHGGYGTDGVYSTDRVATWAAQMNPDVVMFNEIEKYTGWGNQDQPEVYKNLLQQKTGKTWYYVFAQEYGQWSANGKGNLILSTYPINISDRYELVRNADRSIAMATITVNGRDITLINTHLDPYDQALRLAQATEVTAWSAVQPENRIITGDMNAWPDQTSIAHFNKTYHDSWAVAAAQGTATAFAGNNGQTKNGRIDYIFYSKNSANLTVKSSQVYDTRDANGVDALRPSPGAHDVPRQVDASRHVHHSAHEDAPQHPCTNFRSLRRALVSRRAVSLDRRGRRVRRGYRRHRPLRRARVRGERRLERRQRRDRRGRRPDGEPGCRDCQDHARRPPHRRATSS